MGDEVLLGRITSPSYLMKLEGGKKKTLDVNSEPLI